ncbi:mitochondrial carrier [Tilletiaria anomala UBC 951]|uniref:Mitochondrial carrier n=1 Tax=Tilletiaria anomala (strain ATCC 24038 / CBS 436.72 / UBC 951) TaxID=1037660 RepID=A0A066VTB4_TILAU|nr:mitochondrial carrier [Tilletiaria anomala UBC 951]KDN44711.1 mitochondrial carrier [Tilletiaria anomala UBC 951]
MSFSWLSSGTSFFSSHPNTASTSRGHRNLPESRQPECEALAFSAPFARPTEQLCGRQRLRSASPFCNERRSRNGDALQASDVYSSCCRSVLAKASEHAGPVTSAKRHDHQRSYYVHTPVEDGDSGSSGFFGSCGSSSSSLYLPTEAQTDKFLWEHRTQVTAGTASLVSTMASFPFDSVKSRLQVKDYPPPAIWNCTKAVAREEGLGGFFRGVTIPLITITFVRTSSFSIYYSTKDRLHNAGYYNNPKNLWDIAMSGAAAGATSGVIISCGSAPFELVKVQRQLEYLIAVQNGLVRSPSTAPGKPGRPSKQAHERYKPQSGFQAASAIWKNHGGIKGFYIGFPLHIMRDTLGTTLYFGFYDTMRSLVQRHSSGDSNSGPQLFGIPCPVVSFLTGSTAGIASWLIVYPVDLLKTNVQKRELSGHPRKLTGLQLFARILSERPPPPGQVSTDTLPKRFLRLYRGLGVSALRSFISHGMTWSLIETISARISQRVGNKGSYLPGDS